MAVRLATISRCLVLLTVLAVVAACYLAQDIISTIMLALLFSLLFSPLAGFLQRLHLPRALASGRCRRCRNPASGENSNENSSASMIVLMMSCAR